MFGIRVRSHFTIPKRTLDCFLRINPELCSAYIYLNIYLLRGLVIGRGGGGAQTLGPQVSRVIAALHFRR
jgi:hypothetical protein